MQDLAGIDSPAEMLDGFRSQPERLQSEACQRVRVGLAAPYCPAPGGNVAATEAAVRRIASRPGRSPEPAPRNRRIVMARLAAFAEVLPATGPMLRPCYENLPV